MAILSNNEWTAIHEGQPEGANKKTARPWMPIIYKVRGPAGNGFIFFDKGPDQLTSFRPELQNGPVHGHMPGTSPGHRFLHAGIRNCGSAM